MHAETTSRNDCAVQRASARFCRTARRRSRERSRTGAVNVRGHRRGAYSRKLVGHPKAREVFRASRAVRDSPEILVCRLIDAKVTYVHSRLWPALVRLADKIEPSRLEAIREEQTSKELCSPPRFLKIGVTLSGKTRILAVTRALPAKLPAATRFSAARSLSPRVTQTDERCSADTSDLGTMRSCGCCAQAAS